MESALPFDQLQAWVPGEVLIELTPEAAEDAAARRSFAPFRTLTMEDTPEALGIGPVDGRLVELETEGVRDLEPPPPAFAAVVPDEQPPRYYQVRFNPERASTDQAVALLSEPSKQVARVWPNHLRVIQQDPSDGDSIRWALEMIGVAGAWTSALGDPTVRIAVIDTGVDFTHPDLVEAVDHAAGRDFFSGGSPFRLPPGFHWETPDPGNPDADPMDDLGHGTHIAGIIASRPNPGGGVAGVASGCRVVPIRALGRAVHDATGTVTGIGSVADIVRSIHHASQVGAKIINMSFGFPNFNGAEFEAVRVAFHRGALSVAAVGNKRDPADPATLFYPAGYGDSGSANFVVGVGGVAHGGSHYALSMTGEHVDIAAPARSIRSLGLHGGVEVKSGTSMAAGFVSGVAALIASQHPAWSPREIRDQLLQLVDTRHPREVFGAGLLNARNVLTAWSTT